MRRTFHSLLLMCVLALLAGCGQANVVPTAMVIPTALPTETPAATFTPTAVPVSNAALDFAEPARVRIVNAAADSPALNVLAGFSAIATNLAYTQFTEPTQLDAGQYTVKVLASGSSSSDKPLLETAITLKGGADEILLVTGSGTQLSLQIIPDHNEALKVTESVIHVINSLSDSGNVTLKSSTADLAADVKPGETKLTPIMAAEDTAVTVLVGDKSIPITAALKGQSNTTLVIAGSAAAPTIIQFNRPAPERVSVRALNVSTEISSVDVYLDDTPLNLAVDYGRPTDRQNFASGQYTARFYAAGADRNSVEPLAGQVVSLTNGDSFTVMLLGAANQLKVLAFADNLAPTTSEGTRIAFLNTLSSVPQIDIQPMSGNLPLIPTLAYGQVPTSLDITAGSYTFLMSALNQENVRGTIERAENVQLEAGNYYLYLVTGRLDTPPLILSEKVSAEAPTTDGSSQTGSTTAQVRFVSAVNGQQALDFTVNGESVLSGLKYGEGSSFIPVSDQSATISVSSSSPNFRGEQDATFEAGSRYTVLAYLMSNGTVGLMVVNDDGLIFDGSSPHLRLINVSASESQQIGLAFSMPNANGTPAAVPTDATPAAEVTEDPNQPSTVYTLPYGVQKLVSNIGAGSESSVILMPVGSFDLELIESANNKLSLSLPAVTLGANVHMDVIAYFNEQSRSISAFTLPYPTPQA